MTSSIDPRRRFVVGTLLGAGALAPWSTLSLAASANASGNRFVLVILRGGMDGLSAVPAPGDPSFEAARGPLGRLPAPTLALTDLFAFHPQLVESHAAYRRGELAVVHAVGLPYRERSHFDAQQLLESGGTRPYDLATGWLGRALSDGRAKGLALNTAVPLRAARPGRGRHLGAVGAAEPSADLIARLERLYANDAALATALQRAKALQFDGAPAMPGSDDGAAMTAMSGPAARPNSFAALARRASAFLAQPDGPQAAVLELGGWDTHANQANPNGAFVAALRQLDAGLAALREGLVATDVWKRTVVVVATEFGREVAVNGTLGTDHGTGGAAFVLGGTVKGGRVIADWPGLAKADRFEGRDLRTTTDLRAVLKGVLGDHLQIARKRLDGEVFPDSAAVRPLALLT